MSVYFNLILMFSLMLGNLTMADLLLLTSSRDTGHSPFQLSPGLLMNGKEVTDISKIARLVKEFGFPGKLKHKIVCKFDSMAFKIVLVLFLT